MSNMSNINESTDTHASQMAERIFARILKAQNRKLIEQICASYGLDLEEMLARYWTPSFYLPDVEEVTYPIKVTTRGKKTAP